MVDPRIWWTVEMQRGQKRCPKKQVAVIQNAKKYTKNNTESGKKAACHLPFSWHPLPHRLCFPLSCNGVDVGPFQVRAPEDRTQQILLKNFLLFLTSPHAYPILFFHTLQCRLPCFPVCRHTHRFSFFSKSFQICNSLGVFWEQVKSLDLCFIRPCLVFVCSVSDLCLHYTCISSIVFLPSFLQCPPLFLSISLRPSLLKLMIPFRSVLCRLSSPSPTCSVLSCL